MTDPLWFYLLAVPVVLLVGISKGGFAGGLGTLAVPLLTLMVDPRMAAAIMLPILCAMDIFSVWEYRRAWDRETLKILIPGAVLGIVIGGLTFHVMNGDMIRIIVGAMSVYFVANYWFVQRRRGVVAPQPQNALRGGILGGMSGFASFIAHAGGPPLSQYLFPLQLDKTRLVGTSVMFFIIVNYVKLIPYAWLGQLSFENLKISLYLLPFAPLGVWLGIWLHNRVSNRFFYIVAYLLLFLVGVKLLAEGLYALV
ncbi:sulfite exporter TauE/SafE family protein [Paremcibacter congregatus]|uniref:sulfite exporter TauE/SafE family protein n=1 Tax=Paremcibacter congregatus TaxID=2043170 RepID=UPI00195C6E2B|nr:sulfite exporter TauE/SafE family protein [Paremcibacter congregatus]